MLNLLFNEYQINAAVFCGISKYHLVQIVDAGWKKHWTEENTPKQSSSQASHPGCWDSLIPFHKSDIHKELKGGFLHADGSAALPV